MNAIESTVCSEQAERIVASAAADWTVRAERRLYYPYYWFLLRYSARTLLGEAHMPVSCLVDARTRIASTSEPFRLETIEPGADRVADSCLDETAALRIAERYTSYVMRNRRKALVVPRVEALQRTLIYKPFWIVACTRADEPGFSVLVDAVTGGFHVLSGAAAEGNASRKNAV